MTSEESLTTATNSSDFHYEKIWRTMKTIHKDYIFAIFIYFR